LRRASLTCNAKKITIAVLSSGDADLGSLTKMLANTALDDD
jgi:hypothetical protein